MASTTAGLSRPWLFEAFPGLEGCLPWVPLVDAPTPVERLEQVSSRLGREVWIKRDDLTSTDYGGNKPRKLEFILGRAMAQGRQALFTGGGLGTNHGLATAIFGRKLGFSVTLGLFYQPVTDHVRKSLRLFHAYGAEMIYMGSIYGFGLRFYVTERLRRPGTFFVAPGGSSAVGTLGYVDAGLELAGQIERGELPLPEVIFVAAGSCGTMAGLILGLRLSGLQTRVVGVRVATSLAASPKAALKLARKAHLLLQRLDPAVPGVEVTMADVVMDHEHFGPGYGHPTPSGRAALELMAEAEGIELELTYTGKTFGALMDHLKNESREGPVLYWHTYNSVGLSDQARGVDYHSLPETFHRFFEEETAS